MRNYHKQRVGCGLGAELKTAAFYSLAVLPGCKPDVALFKAIPLLESLKENPFLCFLSVCWFPCSLACRSTAPLSVTILPVQVLLLSLFLLSLTKMPIVGFMDHPGPTGS